MKNLWTCWCGYLSPCNTVILKLGKLWKKHIGSVVFPFQPAPADSSPTSLCASWLSDKESAKAICSSWQTPVIGKLTGNHPFSWEWSPYHLEKWLFGEWFMVYCCFTNINGFVFFLGRRFLSSRPPNNFLLWLNNRLQNGSEITRSLKKNGNYMYIMCIYIYIYILLQNVPKSTTAVCCDWIECIW